MRRGTAGPFRDPLLLGVAGRGAWKSSAVGSVGSVVEEGPRRVPVAIHCRRDTPIDEDAGVVAENERVRRLRAPVGEGGGHAEGDVLSVHATDVAPTGQARERGEG